MNDKTNSEQKKEDKKLKNVRPKKVVDPNNPETTREFATEVVLDDLLGRDDWKRSKLGYLSGASVISRTVGTTVNTATDSISRLGSLSKRVFGNQNLPAIEPGGTEEARFIAAIQLYGKSEDDIALMRNNTYKSALLYGGLTIVAIFVGLFSFSYIPYRGGLDALARFAPFFIIAPLALKNTLTNYILRHRRLVGLGTFLKSGDIFPKK